MIDLSTLNPEQLSAVTVEIGPIAVLAGPGSGKTRFLSHRIAYLIETLDVSTGSILAVTFTNKAANEMHSRLIRLIGDRAGRLTAGTFHAIFAQVLRAEAEPAGYRSNFSIADEKDQEKLVKEILGGLQFDPKRFPPAELTAAISYYNNNLIRPEDALDYALSEWDASAVRVYTCYQARLVACNLLDFDDLIMQPVLLFTYHPEIRDKYRRIFRHILVDE